MYIFSSHSKYRSNTLKNINFLGYKYKNINSWKLYKLNDSTKILSDFTICFLLYDLWT